MNLYVCALVLPVFCRLIAAFVPKGGNRNILHA